MRVRYFVYLSLALTLLAHPKPASGQEEYFAVFMEGKKVGYAIQNRIVAKGKVTTSENVKITVSRIGIPQDLLA